MEKEPTVDGRYQQVLRWFAGGSITVLVVGFLGSIIYNGCWITDNKYRNNQFGHQHNVYRVAVTITAFSAACIVFIVVSVILMLSGAATVPTEAYFWTITFVLTAIVIILESIGMNLTRYGDIPVHDYYDYYQTDQKFRNYVTRFNHRDYESVTDLCTVIPESFLRKIGGEYYPGNCLDRFNWRFPYCVDFSDYYQFVVVPNGSGLTCPDMFNFPGIKRIVPCAFNWTFLRESGKLSGSDPCDFDIEPGDELGCIGYWNASKFKNFWCHQYKKRLIPDYEWNSTEGSVAKWSERKARRILNRQAVGSLSAFYGHTEYFLGINVCAFVIGIISIAFDLQARKVDVVMLDEEMDDSNEITVDSEEAVSSAGSGGTS